MLERGGKGKDIKIQSEGEIGVYKATNSKQRKKKAYSTSSNWTAQKTTSPDNVRQV